ncbi:right-handed parallel beta-helix repeat-containing protein [Thalassotalea agariperforans]
MLKFFTFINLLLATVSLPLMALEIDSEKLFLSRLQPSTKATSTKHTITVSNTTELLNAVNKANTQGDTLIYLHEGQYNLKQTIFIKANNIHIVSLSQNPFNTVISGQGMRATKTVDNLIRVSGANFQLDGVTLEEVGNHLIQIVGESEANNPTIRNSVLQNGYEQLLKVTYDNKKPNAYSSSGIVENCLFRYTAGIGPNYYIGGIDAHGIKDWVINNNIFENIASPSRYIAEHAIHIWNNSAYNEVSNNIIINSDRGIGFGMYTEKKINHRYGHLGGEIRNNIIYHADNNPPFADTGIILEQSPDTNVVGNIILLEHSYRSAIEYRFTSTVNVLIAKNITNKKIQKRNGAEAILLENITNKKQSELALKDKLKLFLKH